MSSRTLLALHAAAKDRILLAIAALLLVAASCGDSSTATTTPNAAGDDEDATEQADVRFQTLTPEYSIESSVDLGECMHESNREFLASGAEDDVLPLSRIVDEVSWATLETAELRLDERVALNGSRAGFALVSYSPGHGAELDDELDPGELAIVGADVSHFAAVPRFAENLHVGIGRNGAVQAAAIMVDGAVQFVGECANHYVFRALETFARQVNDHLGEDEKYAVTDVLNDLLENGPDGWVPNALLLSEGQGERPDWASLPPRSRVLDPEVVPDSVELTSAMVAVRYSGGDRLPPESALCFLSADGWAQPCIGETVLQETGFVVTDITLVDDLADLEMYLVDRSAAGHADLLLGKVQGREIGAEGLAVELGAINFENEFDQSEVVVSLHSETTVRAMAVPE